MTLEELEVKLQEQQLVVRQVQERLAEAADEIRQVRGMLTGMAERVTKTEADVRWDGATLNRLWDKLTALAPLFERVDQNVQRLLDLEE